ncbi:hypothetical protein ACE01N_20135 [Saccharicrinis sp. FJH2]|uniref:hypothetical protein n=1 Tax=Saccharicrinis sp. FJH65 TaxID=3344659 RepID=UPI0035F2F040
MRLVFPSYFDSIPNFELIVKGKVINLYGNWKDNIYDFPIRIDSIQFEIENKFNSELNDTIWIYLMPKEYTDRDLDGFVLLNHEYSDLIEKNKEYILGLNKIEKDYSKIYLNPTNFNSIVPIKNDSVSIL